MSLPYFPLYPKDLFTDDRFLELSTMEKGVWLVLICRMWIAENELADDDARLSRVLDVKVSVWKGLKLKLMASGLLVSEGGIIKNKRLTYEFLRICHKSDQSKRAALIMHRKEKDELKNVDSEIANAPISGKEKLEQEVERIKKRELRML